MSLFCDVSLSDMGMPDDRRTIPHVWGDSKYVPHTSAELAYIDGILARMIPHVCKIFGGDYAAFKSKTRKRESVLARHIVCYILGKYTRLTLQEIGDRIRPDYDHATVMHAKRAIQNLISTNRHFREAWQNEFQHFGALLMRANNVN